MNVINNNEELIMEELFRIEIISISGWGTMRQEYNLLNLLKVMKHFCK